MRWPLTPSLSVCLPGYIPALGTLTLLRPLSPPRGRRGTPAADRLSPPPPPSLRRRRRQGSSGEARATPAAADIPLPRHRGGVGALLPPWRRGVIGRSGPAWVPVTAAAGAGGCSTLTLGAPSQMGSTRAMGSSGPGLGCGRLPDGGGGGCLWRRTLAAAEVQDGTGRLGENPRLLLLALSMIPSVAGGGPTGCRTLPRSG